MAAHRFADARIALTLTHMDLIALLYVLVIGVLVVQIVRAIRWLVALPPGTIVDAMLSASADVDDDDLNSRTPAQRNRYRALRR